MDDRFRHIVLIDTIGHGGSINVNADSALLDPIGLDLGNLSDTRAMAVEQGVRQGVFGAMQHRFDGQIGAFAYLLFVLLYFPCVATVGAIKREAGRTWAIAAGHGRAKPEAGSPR